MNADQLKYSIAIMLAVAFLLYSGFLYSNLPQRNIKVTADQYRGKLLWQKYNCAACHQVYGLGGYLGPDLTNAYSLKGPAFIRGLLKNGNNIMPNFKMDEGEIQALTDYLQNMDQSGKADPRRFSIERNGTITQ